MKARWSRAPENPHVSLLRGEDNHCFGYVAMIYSGSCGGVPKWTAQHWTSNIRSPYVESEDAAKAWLLAIAVLEAS